LVDNYLCTYSATIIHESIHFYARMEANQPKQNEWIELAAISFENTVEVL
jgi:hypothetical protein